MVTRFFQHAEANEQKNLVQINKVLERTTNLYKQVVKQSIMTRQ